MSRAHLEEFLAQRVKGLTPERREIVATVIDQSRRSSTRTVVFHAAIAERLGLNPSDHKCADFIANESGPVTAGHLAELTGLSTGAITGVIDRLERAGFVSRAPDPQDRRKVVITGCLDGHGRLPDMLHLFLPLIAGMASVCEHYSDDELKLIVEFMQRCGEVVEQRIQALREPALLGARSAPPSPLPEKQGKKPVKTARARTSTKR